MFGKPTAFSEPIFRDISFIISHFMTENPFHRHSIFYKLARLPVLYP